MVHGRMLLAQQSVMIRNNWPDWFLLKGAHNLSESLHHLIRVALVELVLRLRRGYWLNSLLT